MKARKLLIPLFIISALLLNSCIVKSLFPFFTAETVYYEKAFIGIWEDDNDDKGNWEVKSFKEEFLKTNTKHKVSELSEDDLNMYNKYKEGYFIRYSKKNSETLFLGMPFKIGDELFVDFTLAEINKPQLNILTILHFNPVHTLAKFEVLENDRLSIKWLDEEKINNLFEQKRIKIKHEKVGFDNSYLLTSSPQELQKFIKKYLTSNNSDIWSSDIKFNLLRIDAKP